MSVRVLIGEGRALETAVATATELGIAFEQIALASRDRYNFDVAALHMAFAPERCEVFVALDERAVNYARHKLIADVRLAGYRLMNLVSSRALLDHGVRLMGNVYVGAGCNLAAGTVVGFGSWLERQVTLGQGVKLGNCVTLLNAVTLGEGVTIGTGSTIGSGTFADKGTQVGRHCEWLLADTLPLRLPDSSFFDAILPEGARMLNR